VPATSPKALVLLRVPRGDLRPTEERVRSAIAADRRRLGLPDATDSSFRLAGPYPIEVDDRVLDEYVAWEI